MKKAASQLNDFSLRVLREVLQESKKGENVVIAPVGVAACTATLADGSKDVTRDELLKALSANKAFSATECSGIYRFITKPVPDVDVTFASSIYAPGDVSFERAFKEKFSQDFDGTIQTASTPEKLQAQIIEWVKTKSCNMIVLKPEDITPSNLGVINVLYFKGLWTDQFEPTLTKIENFTKNDNSSMSVDMMHKNFQVGVLYAEEQDGQIIKLPYRTGANNSASPFSMVVLLPKSGQQPEKILSDLTATKLNERIGAMKYALGSLALPRFAIKVDSSLTTTLQKLGVNAAFSKRADFTGMVNNSPVQLDQMNQKLKLIVNERGTEAAAFTEATMTLGGGARDPFEMVVNRPFIVIIRDDRSGAILLIGLVRIPDKDSASEQAIEKEFIQKVDEIEKSLSKKSNEDLVYRLRYTLANVRDYFVSRNNFKRAMEYSNKLIALGKSSINNSPSGDPLKDNLYDQVEIELKMGDTTSAVADINRLIDLFFSERANPSREYIEKYALLRWEFLFDECDKHFTESNQNPDRLVSAKIALFESLIPELAKSKERHNGAWRREMTTIGIPDPSVNFDFKLFLSRFKRDIDVLSKDAGAMQKLQNNNKAFLDWHPTFQASEEEALGPYQSKLARLYLQTKHADKAVKLLELSILNLIEDKNSESVVENLDTLIEVLNTLGRSEEATELSKSYSKSKSTINAYISMHKIWDSKKTKDQEAYIKEYERQEREDAERERKNEKK